MERGRGLNRFKIFCQIQIYVATSILNEKCIWANTKTFFDTSWSSKTSMSQLRTLEEGVGNGSLIVLQERGACQLELFQLLCLCVRISHKQSLMDLRGGAVSVDFPPSADLHSARSIKAGQCPSFSPRHSALSSCGSSRPNVFTATTWESLVRAEFERDRWICLGLRDFVTDKCKLTL